MVVLGPKELPGYLRKAGQVIGRLRRLAIDMREKSGIDEVLRTEGLDREIADFRRLARGEVGSIMSAVRAGTTGAVATTWATDAVAAAPPPDAPQNGADPYAVSQPFNGAAASMAAHEREFPPEGADCYGALPDTAVVYDEVLAPVPSTETAPVASPEDGDAPQGEPPDPAHASPTPTATSTTP
jgi:sec-independent protein translocase protein TatB